MNQVGKHHDLIRLGITNALYHSKNYLPNYDSWVEIAFSIDLVIISFRLLLLKHNHYIWKYKG